MNKYLVSFIMPCYNEKKEYFRAAVESVLNQTYRNIELIIILDKPDNEILKKEAERFLTLDRRVRFYINEKNLGLVGTLNYGIKLVKGQIIARFDSDDIAHPDRIEKQIKYIDKYDIVSTNFAFISSNGEIIRHRVFPSSENEVKDYLLNNADCMYHTTWLIKKKVYEALSCYRNIGPFEDYDLLLRALQEGFKLINISEELNYVRVNPIGISYSNKVLQHLGSEYIRNNFFRINTITKSDISDYINSDIGKLHSEEYTKFYKLTSKIYSSKNIVEYYFRLIMYGPYMAIFNYYGRRKIALKFGIKF